MGEMHANVAQLGGECCDVTVLAADVAMIRTMHGTDVVRHLMAIGAAGSELRCVVLRRAEGTENCEDRNRRDGDSHQPNESNHERNPVPFQLRTRDRDA